MRLSPRAAPPGPEPGVPVPAEIVEQQLLEGLREAERAHRTALWECARFYSCMGMIDAAVGYLRRFAAASDGPEHHATACLAMGQLMEQAKQFEAALEFYRRAYSMEPADPDTWYWVNNNLGFCLNRLGRPDEGEGYCRAAIQINPRRSNAHKNLGLSLQAQGRLAEAAAAFVEAVRANPADRRGLMHLERLCEQHPELLGEVPGLPADLEDCRRARRG